MKKYSVMARVRAECNRGGAVMKSMFTYLLFAYLALAYVVAGLVLVVLADIARELRDWRTWLVILFWPVDIIIEIVTLLREKHR